MTESEILTAISSLLDKQLYLDITRLKELNARQNAFVANVSHEFKSPLTAVLGHLENLADGILGPIAEKQRQSLGLARHAVERLSRMVRDLLDLAKIEAGKISLKKKPVDLSQILDRVLKTYSPIFGENRITIQKDRPPDRAILQGDPDCLEEVLINILDNSLKFTPAGGWIKISLKPENAGWRLEIEDSGPGIPSENLEKIFDKFESLETSSRQGTGLGLPIARDLIRLHGGRIRAESKAGRGAKFIIELE